MPDHQNITRADKISYVGHNPRPAPAAPEQATPPAACPPCTGDCNQGRACSSHLYQAAGGQKVDAGKIVHATQYALYGEPDDADGLAPLTELFWIAALICLAGLCAGIGIGIAQHIIKTL